MALNITINKVSVAASFTAGATVATAVASGGTTPYVYSLATGGDKFAINSSTGVVTTIAAMDITNIASFSVTATDSTTGTALTITSDVIYPPIQAAIRSKFGRTNVIYKITKDIDLGGGTLVLPEGCTLDFQGGLFTNGTIIGNGTKIKAGLERIFDTNIILSNSWDIEGLHPEWFGAKGDGTSDDLSSIQVCLNIGLSLFIPMKLSNPYYISSPIKFNYKAGEHDEVFYRIEGSGKASLKSASNTFDTDLDFSQLLQINHVNFNSDSTKFVFGSNKIKRVSINYCNFSQCLVKTPGYIQSWYISHCKIAGYNAGNFGWMYLNGGLHNVTLLGCEVEYSIGDFLSIHNGSNTSKSNYGCENLSVIQCLIESVVGAAIKLSCYGTFLAQACYFEQNKGGHIVAITSDGTGSLTAFNLNIIGNTFNDISGSNTIDNSQGNGTYRVVIKSGNGSNLIGNQGLYSGIKGLYLINGLGSSTLYISNQGYECNTINNLSYEPATAGFNGSRSGLLLFRKDLLKYTTCLGSYWANIDGSPLKNKGTTSERPTNTATIGCFYYDTTLNKPIWWTGDKWIDATGATV